MSHDPEHTALMALSVDLFKLKSLNPPKTEGIRAAAGAFSASVERLHGLTSMAGLCYMLGARHGLQIAIAANEVFGVAFPELEDMVTRAEDLQRSSDAVYAVLQTQKGAAWLASCVSPGEALHPDIIQGAAFHAITTTAAVAAWSAFEVLAGDLLVAAVNACPEGLSIQDGSPKRIEKAAGQSPPEAHDPEEVDQIKASGPEEKKVSLADIHRLTKNTFNLSAHMGDLLRDRWSFISLRGIRRAYSTTFREKHRGTQSDAIDSVLSRRSLDSLKTMRNVIVHAAGKADVEYLRWAKVLPDIPQVGDRDPVPLSAVLTASLVIPVVVSGHDLVRAVDDWIGSVRSRANADPSQPADPVVPPAP